MSLRELISIRRFFSGGPNEMRENVLPLCWEMGGDEKISKIIIEIGKHGNIIQGVQNNRQEIGNERNNGRKTEKNDLNCAL